MSDSPDVAAVPWVFCGDRRVPVPRADAFEQPARLVPFEDETWAVACALGEPIAAPPLVEQVRDALAASPGGEVAVIITDSTRPTPSPVVLGPLLAELGRAGVPDDQIVILVGCGLHAVNTDEKRRALVGDAVAARVEVIDAQGIEGEQTYLGETELGVPAYVARRVAGAAFAVAVGTVEPHLYAGFSGGVKTVSVGCAGQKTIAFTHHPAFLSRPGVVLGRLEGNPFQQALREVAARTPLHAVVNVVVDEEGRVVMAASGEPTATQTTVANAHRAAWLRAVPERYDVIVAGISRPKSDSLYQASRPATYLGSQDRPALADGGVLVLCADLPLGVGDGPGEQNFAAVLGGGASPAEIIARGLRGELGPGGQRAFTTARVLERFRIALAGASDTAMLARLGLEAYADPEDAIRAAEQRLGRRPRVLAIADAATTVVHQA